MIVLTPSLFTLLSRSLSIFCPLKSKIGSSQTKTSGTGKVTWSNRGTLFLFGSPFLSSCLRIFNSRCYSL